LRALHCAAQYGFAEMVRTLAELGADVQAQDADGDAPLHLAAYAGHVEVVKTLVQAGAEVETSDADGWRPLHKAAGQGQVALVTTLVGGRWRFALNGRRHTSPG
jgi:ankyrin repeat protein